MTQTGFEKYPKLYGSSRWKKIAKMHLDSNPLCNPCLLSGKETGANTVHHKIPHHGDPKLFWDTDNLMSICASCHSGSARHWENTGYSPAADVNGFPLDEGHPWNKK